MCALGLPPWGAEALSRAAPLGTERVPRVSAGPLGLQRQARLGHAPRERSPGWWSLGNKLPPMGACAGCPFGYRYTCSWVLPGGPPPRSPRALGRGRFSAPLATAVPAHNDMVIVSRGPATRTAQLAGRPSQTWGSCCPGGSHLLSPHLPMGPHVRLHLGLAPVATWGGNNPAGCGHLLAWELGNLFFPVVFTRVRGVLCRCTSHFLLGHFHLCPCIMIFSATLI